MPTLMVGPMAVELPVLLGFVPRWAPLDVVLNLPCWIAGLRLQLSGQTMSSSSSTCYLWLPVHGLVALLTTAEEAKAFRMRQGKTKQCKCWGPASALSSCSLAVVPEDCFGSRDKRSAGGTAQWRCSLSLLGRQPLAEWVAELDPCW